MGPLSGYSALDLTDEKGFLCGRILADLGAEVIKVERPGGDAARRLAPLDSNGASLYWAYYNANKKGITLDVERDEGRELFLQLVKRSDFVIESFAPGHLADLGLSYEALREAHPGVVLVSISPYGQAGPRRDYLGSDITSWAMGGFMYVCGNPDRPPLRPGFPQAYLHGSADAAVGALTALYRRSLTGKGQWVDVSIQACLVQVTLHSGPTFDLNGEIEERTGSGNITPRGALRKHVWACRDGAVTFNLLGGKRSITASNDALAAWIREEGGDAGKLGHVVWEEFSFARVSPEELAEIYRPIEEFFEKHTKDDLYSGARQRGILLCPVFDIDEAGRHPQLVARENWQNWERAGVAGAVRFPGAFARFSATPISLRRPAPSVGEHNEEVLACGMGMTHDKLAHLHRAGVI